MSDMKPYTVKLEQFEGPFDLLLYFIQRDELDIYDIPIAKVTNDFLEYIRHLEQLNLDVASEFILVAATLMRIKARMLIPRKELDDEGNEIDPREELVTRLLEYKQFREAVEDLQIMAEERAMKLDRGNVKSEMKRLAEIALVDAELESVNVYKLFKAFQNALERYGNVKDRYIHHVVKYPYTIREQRSFVVTRVRQMGKVNFNALFSGLENRVHAIVTFLALLELVNSQALRIMQGGGANNFWLTPGDNIASEEE